MTQTTTPGQGSNIPLHASVSAHPDGRGRYAASVSYNDGIVALSVRYVERAWLPLSVFGRVIQTKLVRIGGDSVREVCLTNEMNGLSCTIVREGGDVERITLLGAEWPATLREAVRTNLDSALHRKQGGLSVHLRGKTATLAALFLAYVVVTGLAGTTQPAASGPAPVAASADAPALRATAVPQLSAGEAAGMSSAAVAQAAADSQSSQMPIKDALVKASFITLRPPAAGGKTLVIWSDPLCPHCRDFDQKVLSKLPANLGVTVIPVSFKHGSRPLVSYAACASTAADRASRWKNLLSEQPTGIDIAQQCATGPAVADANTTLFARAGLRSTPTLMKADGEVFEGDQHSVEAVTNWLAK